MIKPDLSARISLNGGPGEGIGDRCHHFRLNQARHEVEQQGDSNG